ncbi:MAG: homoserine dehydrogenase [Actinobacteria bacterium]|nr:homoserine dehydrogenase [Actinomycetota bacterium]
MRDQKVKVITSKNVEDNIDNGTEGSYVENVNIGMFGFGYVGRAVFSLIQNQKGYLSKKIRRNLCVKTIVVKDVKKKRPIVDGLENVKISDNPSDIINDESIDIVIELIGGIEPAYQLVMEALSKGKYVVTANKDLIANRGRELFKAAEENNVDILFEGSVGGGIPIIGPLKSSLASNKISKIVGIINGTTNYILTRMEKEGLAFEDALRKAQELGYAEKANPSSDIEGDDAACKLAILASISFNSRIEYKDVYREGITRITIDDIENAREMGYRIKLIAIGSEEDGKISVRVHPALIPEDHILSSIDGANNAVYVYGDYVGEVMSYGRGAGDRPTASSVVGDIIKIARNFDRKRKGMIYGCTCFETKELKSIDETVSRFYVLMDVTDRPGVLAKIAKVFGDNNVSIKSMVQKQTRHEGVARIVFITHDVVNKNMYSSIEQISRLDVVDRVLNIIRVEDLGK